MANQIIKHSNYLGRISIHWTDDSDRVIPNSIIQMDFNPLINAFNLKGAFCLIHWQGKPFGLRRWGVFCNQSKHYYTVDYNQIQFAPQHQLELLQIDENKFPDIRPTAVLYIANAKVVEVGDKILVD
jgi:hypothetical protein